MDYGSDVNLAVYDAASDSFSVSGQSPAGQVLAVAGSPATREFAVIGTSGFAFVDSNLNVLATPPLGGFIAGMKYSADGSKLYITAIVPFALCGPFYPVILTYDTSSFWLVGEAPSFQVPSGSVCPYPPYKQATPLATDNTGLEFSAASYGLVFDDAANYQNLLNLPFGPPFPQGPATDEAALNMPLATNLGQISFDTLPDVWFGNVRGTNTAFAASLVSVTAPPSPTAALVNVKAVLPDGWFSLTAQAFSYGTQILFVGGNAGSPDGGATLTIIGYGLLGKNAAPAVTIGGASATVLDLATRSVTPGPVLPFPGLQVGGNSFSGSADGSQIFLAGQGCGNFLWVASTNQITTGPVLVSDSSAASGDGNWFASDYARLDGQLIPHMQAQVPDFFYSLPRIANSDINGEKMNASGSLLYTPLSNGIDVTDTNRGTWLCRVQLTETVAPVTPSPMDFDETGNRLFLNTNKGLTVVNLASPPLSIGYLNPSSGPASGGTSVTIRGTGFQSGTTVTFGGVAAPTSFVDTSTLQVTTPAMPAGGVRVTITNPGGAGYSLDAAFQAH